MATILAVNYSQLLLTLLIVALRKLVNSIPQPEPYYGDVLGRLSDFEGIGIQGQVYAVNKTCIQIVNFTYSGEIPDLQFWLDDNPESGLSSKGIKVPTFEYGFRPLGPYNNSRVVVRVPDERSITKFRQFGLWSQQYEKDFGHVSILKGLQPPKAQFLNQEFQPRPYIDKEDRLRYAVRSGPVVVLDRRTIKIYGFQFNAAEVTDTWFFVGKGYPKKSDGVRVSIRGRDAPGSFSPLSEAFTGQVLIIDLPPNHDIYNIDYLSVYHYRFGVDFSHIKIANISDRIPPYVPPQRWWNQPLTPRGKAWNVTTLLGKPGKRTNFTFQLGHPGGKRGYLALSNQRPTFNFVWYVNGYMTPELWMQRGVTYTFKVEGGNNLDAKQFRNPLYITSDINGGYSSVRNSMMEEDSVTYAGMNELAYSRNNGHSEQYVGRLCKWIPRSNTTEDDPDSFKDFVSFKHQLMLTCEPGEAGYFTWTPDENTPGVVYYQSYDNKNMGWKIMVVDEIPSHMKDFEEEPYEYEEYKAHEALRSQELNSSETKHIWSIYCIFLYLSVLHVLR